MHNNYCIHYRNLKFIKEKRNVAFFPSANFGRSINYFDKKYSEMFELTKSKIKMNYVFAFAHQ